MENFEKVQKVAMPIMGTIGLVMGAMIFYHSCNFTSLPLNHDGLVGMKTIHASVGGIIGSVVGIICAYYVPMFIALFWRLMLGVALLSIAIWMLAFMGRFL